ncbi:MAG: hypothetical protein H0V22_04965 [Solirubrobacterales bacterium]|nr:hypothetical protein [Solirubrobacterales bacterium]
MSIRSRSVLSLPLALVAAIALAACGGDQAGGGEKASASTNVDQLLKETFTGEKKVDSATLGLTVLIDAKGAESQGVNGPIKVKLGGPIQGLQGKTLPKFKLDLAFSGAGQNLEAGATSTGDKAFVNFNNQDYAVSDPVFKQLKAGYEEAQKRSTKAQNGKQPSLSTLGIDARKWLTNPRNAGEAKVGNDDTIKITGGVDVSKLLDDVNVALSKASSLGLQNTGQLPQKLTAEQRKQVVDAVKNLKVEIFTGKEDKILRRMVVAMNLQAAKSTGAQSAAVKLDLSLTKLNEDVEIKTPDKTKPFDELLGQLGSLGGLGGAGSQPNSGGSSGSGGASQQELKNYTDCITKAGSDVKAAQDCAKLLTP